MLNSIVSLAVLKEALAKDKTITLQTFQKIQADCFNSKKRNIWLQLKDIIEESAVPIKKSKYFKSYFSLIDLRNFLAHRKGIVGTLDKEKIFYWYNPKVITSSKNLKKPYEMKDRKRTVKLLPGDILKCNLDTYMGISWTLFCLSYEIHEILQNHIFKQINDIN